MGYTQSQLWDFESYLGVVVGLHEDDIQLISRQENSDFVSYDISPGIHSIKDTSQVHSL